VPCSEQSAKVGSTALQVTNPISMEVDGTLWNDRPFEDEDGAVQDLLTSHLFGHLPPSIPGSGEPDKLTRLKLASLTLEFAEETWLKYPDLRNLKVSSLEYCPDAEVFIGGLALNNDRRPNLRELTIIHEAAGQGDPIIDRIDDLLQQTTSLEKINLSIRKASGLPKIISIKPCAATLRQLLLDIIPLRSFLAWLIYSTEEIRELVASCTRLRELGFYLPSVDFLHVSTRWEQDFRRSIVSILEPLYSRLYPID
jgi:hypothetical protein